MHRTNYFSLQFLSRCGATAEDNRICVTSQPFVFRTGIWW